MPSGTQTTPAMIYVLTLQVHADPVTHYSYWPTVWKPWSIPSQRVNYHQATTVASVSFYQRQIHSEVKGKGSCNSTHSDWKNGGFLVGI